MRRFTIFKKLLLPCSFGAAAVAAGDGDHTFGPNCCKDSQQMTKPSELPIYTKECLVCGKAPTPGVQAECSEIEQTISKIRKELWVWQDAAVGYRHKLVDVYRSGVDSATSSLEFLREEANGPERYGAIGLSGVAGFIFGLRGGLFKRLVYATSGALAMAALCYPNEAADYSDQVLTEGKKYFIVGYHFVFGEAPKMPDWRSYLKFLEPESAVKELASDKSAKKSS